MRGHLQASKIRRRIIISGIITVKGILTEGPGICQRLLDTSAGKMVLITTLVIWHGICFYIVIINNGKGRNHEYSNHPR